MLIKPIAFWEGARSKVITSLGWQNDTATNAAQSQNFIVTGDEGAQFSLAGTNGASIPAGTENQTIGVAGVVTIGLELGDNSSGGSPARSCRAHVTASAGTEFSLGAGENQYDDIQQAEGAAAVYDYSLSPTIIGGTGGGSGSLVKCSGSNGLQKTSTIGGAHYHSWSVEDVNASYTASTTFYIFPEASYEFANTGSVTITDLPGWATVGRLRRGTNEGGGNMLSYIEVRLDIDGLSGSNTTETFFVSASATTISTTWGSQANIFTYDHSNFGGGVQQSGHGMNTGVSGTGSKNYQSGPTLVTQDSGTSGETINYYEWAAGDATTGGNLITTASIENIDTGAFPPADVGEAIRGNIVLDIPTTWRLSKSYSGTTTGSTFTLYDNIP